MRGGAEVGSLNASEDAESHVPGGTDQKAEHGELPGQPASQFSSLRLTATVAAFS